MIDIDKIEAAANVEAEDAGQGQSNGYVSLCYSTVLEMVSMIRQRDAVLNRVLTLLGPEAPACSGCADEWEMAIAAIDEVLG